MSRKLPGVLLRLLPLLERSCHTLDLDRELSTEMTARLWKLLTERSQALRECGAVEQTITTATMRYDFVDVLLQCVHRGLILRSDAPDLFSFQGLRRAISGFPLGSAARRLLAGKLRPGWCSEYTDMFQVLYWVAKRTMGFKDLAVVSIDAGFGPQGHAWNWIVSTRNGWIASFDIHAAAVADARDSVGSIWNTALDGTELPHISGLASFLMVAYDLHPPLARSVEVVQFFDELFLSAGEQRGALAQQIAQRGWLRPEVEARVIDRWSATPESLRWTPGRLQRGWRTLLSRDSQMRLLARAFDG